MNESLNEAFSAYESGVRLPRDVIRLVSERMLTHRPRAHVALKPYIHQKNMALAPLSSYAEVELCAAYPNAREGDIAYVKTSAVADRDSEAALTLAGNAEIWLNGVMVYAREDEKKPLSALVNADYRVIPVRLNKGDNILLAKCEKRAENWGFRIYIAYPKYPFLWTRDYLLCVRPALPFAQMGGMEGFAHIGPIAPEDAGNLCGRVEKGEIGYDDALPARDGPARWLPRWADADETPARDVRFAQLYGDARGCAYALTYVETRKGETYALCACASGALRAFAGGARLDAGAGERANLAFEGDGGRMPVLVKVRRDGGEWWLDASVRAQGAQAPVNRVPFVSRGDGAPVRWLVVGPFSSAVGDPMNIAFAPEREIQFTRPYPLGQYESAFWRLPQRDAYVRPYLDGIFFGQWFYAVQVSLHGLMLAAKATGNSEQLRYYTDSVSVLADYFEYKDWDMRAFGNPTLMPRSCDLSALDPCGTIGVSLIETYLLTGKAEILPVVRAIAQAMQNRVPRFADGTFYRVKTMWADDLYMSCPFLARLARLTGDARYTDEVYRQLDGFRERLWIEDKRLFSHVYFVDEARASGIPWGRGNGWIAVTLTEILALLPPEDARWQRALALYQSFMEGLLARQDPTGMWHQAIDHAETYLETSCTGMFLVAIARGVNRGWLEAARYIPCAQKAWEALLRRSVDALGDVYGVCIGSGCGRDADYYNRLPTKKNDDHGTGIVMMAAVEMLKLNKRP